MLYIDCGEAACDVGVHTSPESLVEQYALTIGVHSRP